MLNAADMLISLIVLSFGLTMPEYGVNTTKKS